jgi:hypothetical protein
VKEQPTAWPECGDVAHLMGYDFVCKLPRGHLLDGAQMHQDRETGIHWVLTLHFKDGHEERR